MSQELGDGITQLSKSLGSKGGTRSGGRGEGRGLPSVGLTEQGAGVVWAARSAHDCT